MPYASRSTVVAFKNAKAGALYCEHVVPLQFSELIPIRGSGEPELFDILQKVFPPSLVDTRAPRSVHPGVVDYLSEYLVAFPQSLGITSLPDAETLEDRAKRRLPGLQAKMAQVLASVAEPISGVLEIDPLGEESEATQDVACQLAGLNIVDIDRVSWRHLLEFREDAESLRKLQNLRLFFHEKFDGKSKEYVRDALLLAIEKHDDTVKNWGFETVAGALECVFSSKSLAALGAGTITIALGAPLAVGATLAVVFEIGAATIKIATKRRALSEFRKFDPVSYLIAARNLPTT
jgi:hypothetical protein